MAGQLDLERHTFRTEEIREFVDEALQFFNSTPLCNLPPPERFEGPGVYALYYTGDSPYYAKIAAANRGECTLPIYAGKAVPEGWRTGRNLKLDTRKLYGRLREHARSIERTDNLHLSDFPCRFMILTEEETNLITLVENALFRQYAPLWNAYIDGFGNHDPGKGRYDQAVSEWDTLHPGRPWAERLRGGKPSIASIFEKMPGRLRPSSLP